MTEQEVEALMDWTMRVWNVQAFLEVERGEGGLQLYALLKEDVELQVAAHSGEVTSYWLYEDTSQLTFLYCDQWRGLDSESIRSQVREQNKVERLHCLQAQWLPIFRRGCWLSGCDIEASAHEKMEWIQGFSREELESWNLKI